MAGGGGGASLAQQPRAHLGVAGEVGQQQLDGDLLLEQDVGPLDHGAHAARADEPAEPVLAVEHHAGRKEALGREELAGDAAEALAVVVLPLAVLAADHAGHSSRSAGFAYHDAECATLVATLVDYTRHKDRSAAPRYRSARRRLCRAFRHVAQHVGPKI